MKMKIRFDICTPNLLLLMKLQYKLFSNFALSIGTLDTTL